MKWELMTENVPEHEKLYGEELEYYHSFYMDCYTIALDEGIIVSDVIQGEELLYQAEEFRKNSKDYQEWKRETKLPYKKAKYVAWIDQILFEMKRFTKLR